MKPMPQPKSIQPRRSSKPIVHLLMSSITLVLLLLVLSLSDPETLGKDVGKNGPHARKGCRVFSHFETKLWSQEKQNRATNPNEEEDVELPVLQNPSSGGEDQSWIAS